MKALFVVLSVLVIVMLIMAIPALILMVAWDWLVPSLFNGPQIEFWQAWVLLVICGMLFRRG